MKFAILGHLIGEQTPNQPPNDWTVEENMFVSPEFNFNGAKGYGISIKFSPKQMMELPRDKVRQKILDAALFAQNELGVGLIQLGGLATSVTSGGVWLAEEKQYQGFVNHGDSYTSAVTCQTVFKILNMFEKKHSELVIAIIGAYGIIGEAVSKLLVPKFSHSILIGPRKEKLRELEVKLNGSFETTVDLKTRGADVIVAATNHPAALLNSYHLKEKAIVIDVSQPPNISSEICQQRPDVFRVDGGYVDFPTSYSIPFMPSGKIFACIVEIIMQVMENERQNHVGSIDLEHLYKTRKWAGKYGFTLNELTNFGKVIKNDIGDK